MLFLGQKEGGERKQRTASHLEFHTDSTPVLRPLTQASYMAQLVIKRGKDIYLQGSITSQAEGAGACNNLRGKGKQL
jgi:hypothetical protein